VHPDISVHAKLLTGGLLPLCTTVASESIFEAFLGEEKSEALLHGHSYTAHAVGCHVAVTSLETMRGMEERGVWDGYKRDWASAPRPSVGAKDPATSSRKEGCANARLWSVWSRRFVEDVSCADNVESVIALASVLAISLRDSENAGYTSTAASGLQKVLLEGRVEEEFNVHSRVLGNVLYLMTSLTSENETVRGIESRLRGALGV
jgi:dethiobiotin synthetase/adenosylmethionine--8-amino-7-oxononanoate aminotransferase